MKYVMPSFLREFKCLEEGYCCHRWNISVTPKELEIILSNLRTIPKKNWPEDCGFDIVRDEDNSIKSVYTKNCENRCSFLVDKKCFLHANFGLEGKPEICQSYPFYAMKTPRLSYINISMACPCSLQMLKNENDFTVVNPARTIGSKFSLKADLKKWKTVSIKKDMNTDWDGFYYIHKKLLQKHRNIDFINHLWLVFGNSKQEFFTKEEVVQICEDSFEKQDICRKSHLQSIICAWSAWREQNGDSNDISPVVSYFIKNLGIDLDTDLSTESIDKYFDTFQGKFDDEKVQNVLHNYLFILLFGADFYFTHNIIEALEFISLSIALVKFFALSANSTGEISEDNMLDAIYVLEKFFFHSDYFGELENLSVSPKTLLV